MNLHQTER
jgi:hypothetical protein